MEPGKTDQQELSLPRVAKGDRPRNFSDPAIDALVGIVLSLASELSVVKDRLETLERVLERGGSLRPHEIDGYEQAAEELAERARRRARYMDRILRSVKAELAESSAGRVARPLEDIIGDFAAREF